MAAERTVRAAPALAPLARALHACFVTSAAKRSATLTEFLAIPEEQRFHDLVDGEIIRKADPSGEHGGSQAGDSVRAEPFDAIEIEVGTLFGDDPSH